RSAWRAPRDQRAISIASSTISVRMCDATRQPTIILLNASTMKHTYATPAQVGTNVRSVTHSRFGTVAVNSRLTRSGCLAEARSAGRAPRDQRAISIASSPISVRMCDATRQPTIILLNASTMKHTYATPAQVGTNVRSVTHSRFGTVAVNSRLTRSGCLAEA